MNIFHMHTYKAVAQRFKNIVTERFHEYFYGKLKAKEIDSEEFFAAFEVSGINKFQFFSGMRSGHRGITPEQVQIAWEVYGVRPDYLFGIVNQPVNVLAEPPAAYARGAKKDLDKIRALLDQLEKKIENG
jgi:hypothetical protein